MKWALLLLLSDIEESAGIENIAWIEQLLYIVMNLHVVVSDDSLVQEGADQEENLAGAF